MEEITWEEIRKLQMDERNSPNLNKIEEGTFQKLIRYLEERKKIIEESEKKGEIGREIAKKAELEYKNAKKIIDDFLMRREKKIMENAIRAAIWGIRDTTNMTREEVSLYNKIIESIKEFENLIREKEEEVKEEKQNLLMIRFVEDVPKFKFEERIYGPFKKEDIANLPKKVGEILINAKKAVIIGDKDEDASSNK